MKMTRRSRALLAAVGLAGAFAAGYVSRHLLGSDAGVTVAAPPAVPEDHPEPAPGPAVVNEDTRGREPGARPLEGWKRCVAIVLWNPGRMIEDYTVRFDLPRVWGMLPDCRDLRFTDADRHLPFWIERAGGGGVTAWVRFREIAHGETKVILSYDNPAAARVSDGEAAFLFFDDFESGFDRAKWRTNRDASGGGVGAFVRDGVMHVHGGDDNARGWLRSLVDLPSSLAVESRFKVDRTNDHCRGGLRICDTGFKRRFAGVDYNFYSKQAQREILFANRDSFCVHPERAGVKLSGFWKNIWFRQRLAYDGTSASRNLVYVRDRGEGPEQLVADAQQAASPVRIFMEPWAWEARPTQLFYIDWIAVRNYAPVRLDVTVSEPDGGDVWRFVFDDRPPEEVESDPWPEDGQEVF